MLFSFIVQLFIKLRSMFIGQQSSDWLFKDSSTTTTPNNNNKRFKPPGKITMMSMRKDGALKLAPNIVFKCCPNEDEAPPIESGIRPLVLLFSWMSAKDSHLDKYRNFWFERGFDVLSINTSAADLLLPTVGANRNARNIVRFLTEIQPHYRHLLIHAFSVGCFQSLEFVRTVREDCADPAVTTRIEKSICGIIFDSCAFMDEFERSFSIAVTKNPIKQTVIRVLGKFYVQIVNLLTNNRYEKNQMLGFDNKTQIPGLLLYSKDDQISICRLNDKLYQVWQENQVLSRAKCWNSSIHVQHFRNYPEEYREEVDQFVKMTRIGESLR